MVPNLGHSGIQRNLLQANTARQAARRSWRPRPLPTLQVPTPQPLTGGEATLAAATQILGGEALAAGKVLAKSVSLPTLALLYVLTAAPGCNDKDSSWFSINPAEECAAYPPGKILEGLKIKQINNTSPGPSPAEIARVLDIFGSIDFRLTEGIKEIVFEGREKCEWRGSYYVDHKLGLCRQNDGKGGAFKDNSTLSWVIHHETGHNVQLKIGEKLADFHALFKPIAEKIIPTGANGEKIEWTEKDMNEMFGEYIAGYILAGPYFRLLAEIPEAEKQKFIIYLFEALHDLSIYNWLRENIFCGTEYNTVLDWEQLRIAEIYRKRGDANRALSEYQKLINNYPDSPWLPNAYAGMGNIYRFNMQDPVNAIKMYRKIIELFPAWENASEIQFLIGETYNLELSSPGSAIIEYQKVIDNYPDSPRVPWAFYEIGKCYFTLLNFESVIPYLEKVVSDYPDFEERNLAMFLVGYCYSELGNCKRAVDVLQNLIREYPGYNYNDFAQDLIDECKNR